MSQLTFQIAQPIKWRPASCAEAGCGAFERGWRSAFDESTPEGKIRADYVRNGSGRRFTVERDAAGLTVFTFGAGQQCFASDTHRVPAECRDQVFRVAPTEDGRVAGDLRTHVNGADWVENFSEHLDHIRDLRERG